jgi:hypothetical protein
VVYLPRCRLFTGEFSPNEVRTLNDYHLDDT